MSAELRGRGGWLETAALPLQVVGILSSLVLGLNFCLEILALLALQRDHQVLLLALLICLSGWALLEVVRLRIRGTPLPLTRLLLLLVLQLAVECTRLAVVFVGPPIGIDRSYGLGVWNLEPLIALLPVYMIVFLSIGQALIRTHTAEIESAYRALQDSSAQLERLATTDSLTGAFNRRRFEQVSTLELSANAEDGGPVSVLIFDIDHFKSVNDRFGHQIGDRVLVGLTRLVRANLRAEDTLARWGGEEFIVLLPRCNAEEAIRVAEKLRACIARHDFDPVGRVTCSFGIAQQSPGESLDAWVRRADEALYLAKDQGRDCIRRAEPPG
ncbi:MAG: hypothetical protein RIS35_1121 [Pseudomonadota bacterium]